MHVDARQLNVLVPVRSPTYNVGLCHFFQDNLNYDQISIMLVTPQKQLAARVQVVTTSHIVASGLR
jgi:hypothetical protein